MSDSEISSDSFELLDNFPLPETTQISMTERTTIQTILCSLGATPGLAQVITAVHDLDTFESLRILDDADLANVCKGVRKGTGEKVTDGGPPPLGSNPMKVPPVFEHRFKLLAWYLRYLYHTNVVPTDNITADTLDGPFSLWVKSVCEYKDPKIPELTKKDWQRNFELIDSWLHNNRGDGTHLPRSYVIRPSTERTTTLPKDFADFDDALSASTQIQGANGPRSTTAHFKTDNMKVY